MRETREFTPGIAYPPEREKRVEDEPADVSHAFWINELAEFKRNLKFFTRLIVDKSLHVDEYRVQGAGPLESVTQIDVPPGYDTTEVIENIIVTGPVTASPATIGPAFLLKLGKRAWNLALPTSGILVISPVSIELSRSDDRFITPAAAGDWALELTGYAIKGRYS